MAKKDEVSYKVQFTIETQVQAEDEETAKGRAWETVRQTNNLSDLVCNTQCERVREGVKSGK